MLSISANDKSPVTLPENNEWKLVVNELLCFVTNKYDNHPKSVIHDTIVEFCREDEIFAAKQTHLLNVVILPTVHRSSHI